MSAWQCHIITMNEQQKFLCVCVCSPKKPEVGGTLVQASPLILWVTAFLYLSFLLQNENIICFLACWEDQMRHMQCLLKCLPCWMFPMVIKVSVHWNHWSFSVLKSYVQWITDLRCLDLSFPSEMFFDYWDSSIIVQAMKQLQSCCGTECHPSPLDRKALST